MLIPQLILFDWGDTLMRDDPRSSAPMCEWPEVDAFADAKALLALLQLAGIRCGLATGARVSTEVQIRAALQRAEIGHLIDPVFCYRNLGASKDTPQYWHKLLKQVALPVNSILMIGDDLQRDVRIPARLGISAIWLNRDSTAECCGPGYLSVHDLRDVAARLPQLGFQLPA
ncbi:HAD family hydrolase [Chitinilyticum piscinae]|uniref:HAD family hydrolase n=1 Tax=Chitinilyticum piscinae TaxID=2866724 RepID=A0A8J7FZS9_9NEIS|nr:HAD family hydrolase [Chitinilyticum piscinae]MBE9609350.1 HAD family hydrolase [Chitinilyticum piscinae]